MANPSWVQYLPSVPPPIDPNSPLAPPRCRCVTYVNKKIKNHFIAQTNSQSSLVVALQLTYDTDVPPIHLLNAYLPPACSEVAEILSPALILATPGPVLMGLDSNLHHPTWNPPSYTHSHKAADELVMLAASHHLTLRSELGVPTFYATSDRSTNTTIDLLWANEEAHELATTCLTDVSMEHSHSSDHAALLTTLNLPTQTVLLTPPRPKLNWKKVDEAMLSSSLASSLAPLSSSLQNDPNIDQLDSYVEQVTSAINSSIQSSVPLSTPPPNARRWWNETILGPLKRRTSALRRKYQLYKSEDNKASYLSSAKTFHHTILRLKQEHWREYLLGLDDKTLFSAARFTEGPAPPSFIPPLRLPSGSLSSDPTTQAELLFKGTSAPTIDTDLSDISTPPHRTRNSPPFTVKEALSVITNLKPSKAPGPDKIPSLVLKLGGLAMAECIISIANASLNSGKFPTTWKVAKSVIIKKIGKPDYSNPGAYRPIALLNTLSKTVEAMVACRLRDFVESRHLLHPGHYGGRQRRSTTDALTHLTTWTKARWRENKFVGALFVDVQAAFPTVHPTRMVSTLTSMGVCPALVSLIGDYLSNRSTTIAFGDFESEPKTLSIGLPQGSPLSVILYIIYNSSLLEQSSGIPDTISLGFIDDVAFATSARSPDELVDKLQILASRELRWGKRHGAAFDKKKSQWVLFTHRPQAKFSHLKIRLGTETLSPQDHIKWLGVLLDPKLSFKLHGQAAQKKGTLALLKLRSLARSGWGLSTNLFLRLVSSLVHSRTDYASLIWHSYGKHSATTHALQRLDNTAQRLALGAFRSHPLLFLRHDSNCVSVIERLDSKSDNGVLRLLTLPLSSPACVSMRLSAAYRGSRHLHPIARTLASSLSVTGGLSGPVECIDPSLLSPPCPTWLSIRPDPASVQPNDTSPSQTVLCLGIGKHHSETGAGAAAYAPMSRKSMSLHIPHPSSSTQSEAELLAIWLAARLAKHLCTPHTTEVVIVSSSHSTVSSLQHPSKPSSGQHLRRALWHFLLGFNSTDRTIKVRIVWQPSIDCDTALSCAEKASSAAIPPTISFPIPASALAVAAAIKRAKRRLTSSFSPSAADLTRLHGLYDPPATAKALSGLPRPLSTAIVQLRAGHSPLSGHLFWCKRAISPNCDLCGCPETVEHYLLICRRYNRPRASLATALKKTKQPLSLSSLLYNPATFPLTADYIRRTWRFSYLRRPLKPTLPIFDSPPPTPPS